MNVVLWIVSETEAEIAKSFNDAACRLDLPGRLETITQDQNRLAVLQWLQTSSGRSSATLGLLSGKPRQATALISTFPLF